MFVVFIVGAIIIAAAGGYAIYDAFTQYGFY
jgi:hypothetical protein